tara:strand:+ start:683 stop:1216 length:534 start_codon:yes stop_codon:yes gene_type:complete
MTDKKDNKPNLKLLDGGKSNQDKTKKTSTVGVELTAKQLGFCKDIVGMGGKKGMTLVDAYRNNYNVSKDIKGNSLRAMSSKLRADVNITLTVNRLLAQKDSLQRMQTVSLGEQIIQDLLAFSKDENITDSVRVKSLELVGKNLGLWTDKIEVDNKQDRSSADIEHDLIGKLNAMIKK